MEPLEKLKLMTAWNSDPTLTEDELNALIEAASRPDQAGIPPGGDDWQPTYDLNKAAAEAWLVKAGRAAKLVEIDPPESGIVTSKIFENCRAMARLYASKRKTSVSIG